MHHFRGVSLTLSHTGMRHIMHHIRGSLHKFYAWFDVPVTWAYLEGRILLLCTIYVVYNFCTISCSFFSDVPITWCIIFLFLTMGHSFDVPHSWCTNYTLLLFLWLFIYHLRGAFLWLSGDKLSFSLISLGPTYVVHSDSILCAYFISDDPSSWGISEKFSIILLCAYVILVWFIRYATHNLTLMKFTTLISCLFFFVFNLIFSFMDLIDCGFFRYKAILPAFSCFFSYMRT